MGTGDAWCAATVSAAAIACNLTKYYPVECSCNRLISIAKSMGIWVEDDAYKPTIGDLCLYDWQDGSNYFSYDNKSEADHIGMVTKVSGTKFTVTEGNMGKPSQVGDRTLSVNGRYIRGFVHPKLGTTPAPKPVREPLVVDGIGGIKTITRWQEVIGSAYVDGTISGQYKPNKKWFPALTSVTYEDTGESQLVKITQVTMGLDPDGYMGPDYARGLNKRLGLNGTTIDKNCVMALQKTLNMGKF